MHGTYLGLETHLEPPALVSLIPDVAVAICKRFRDLFTLSLNQARYIIFICPLLFHQ